MKLVMFCFLQISCLFFSIHKIIAQERDSNKIENDKLLLQKYEAKENPIGDISITIGYYTKIDSILKKVMDFEVNNLYNDEISDSTRKLIGEIELMHLLAQVESKAKNTIKNLYFRNKLVNFFSDELKYMSTEQYSMYTYDTKNKSKLKFVSVRSGNDLFTVAGIYDLLIRKRNKYINDNRVVFQRNDDRDYTGSFLIEFGTDYFSHFFKTNPKLKYATIFAGFDVFTPYFRDTITFFRTDTSFNSNDRPHATFQYLGFSQKGIVYNNTFKYSVSTKFGKIGGNIGEKFQNALHQDISQSDRPKGWGAQIANGGRIGLSFEGTGDIYIKCLSPKFNTNKLKLNHIWPSIILDGKIGSYMTNLSLGLKISNRSFNQINDNFITYRSQYKHNLFERFMYSASFKFTGVLHNTMLEGYGWVNTIEDTGIKDPLTPNSIYYLNYNQLRRIVPSLNISIAYSSSNLTFFYNWMSLGPETTLGDIQINSLYSGEHLNIKNRWHHFAEIGIVIH